VTLKKVNAVTLPGTQQFRIQNNHGRHRPTRTNYKFETKKVRSVREGEPEVRCGFSFSSLLFFPFFFNFFDFFDLAVNFFLKTCCLKGTFNAEKANAAPQST
jgi:hypothetical protein